MVNLIDKEVLSVEEARKIYFGNSICRSGFYESVRRNEIPSIRIGRRIFIPRRALEAMLAGELAGQEARVDG